MKKYVERLSKLAWLISLPLFLIGLLYAYVTLPEPIRLFWNRKNELDYYIARSVFFYTSISVFIVFNIFWIIVRFIFTKRQSMNLLFVELHKRHFIAWTYSFNFLVNISGLIYPLYVSYLHRPNLSSTNPFLVIFYFFVTLIVIWLIRLIQMSLKSFLALKKHG